MSRSPEDLDPAFRFLLEEAIKVAKEQKSIIMVPYMTLRSPFEQAKLWRQSRPTHQIVATIANLKEKGAPFLAHCLESVGPSSGPWATNAFPGKSWHQWGLAADLYWKTDRDGDGDLEPEWNNLTGYKKFGEVCRNLGLTSGYFWRSRDAVHVQHPTDPSPKDSLSVINDVMEKKFG